MKKLFPLAIVYVNAMVWYNMFYTQTIALILEEVGLSSQLSVVKLCFNIALALSLTTFGFHVERLRKTSVIVSWGAAMPVCALILYLNSDIRLIIVTISILGSISGLALLAFSAHFADRISLEWRGRSAGMMTLASLLATPAAIVLLYGRDYTTVLIFYVLLGIATSLIAYLSNDEKCMTTTKLSLSIYRNRSFILYLVPWLIITFVNGSFSIALSILFRGKFPIIAQQAIVISYLTASFGASVGGIVIDKYGRRFILVLGLVAMGITLTVMGLTENYITFIIYLIVQGFAWGVFMVLYTLVIWGDLAERRSSGPYYAVGLGVFFLTKGLNLSDYFLRFPIAYVALMNCLILFLSIIPLFYAPETLKRRREFVVEVKEEVVKKELERILGTEHFKELLKRIRPEVDKRDEE